MLVLVLAATPWKAEMVLGPNRSYLFLDAEGGAATQARVYVRPRAGIGLVYDAFRPQRAGVWLDPTSLRPLYQIQGTAP